MNPAACAETWGRTPLTAAPWQLDRNRGSSPDVDYEYGGVACGGWVRQALTRQVRTPLASASLGNIYNIYIYIYTWVISLKELPRIIFKYV